jgi:hypothetical protein
MQHGMEKIAWEKQHSKYFSPISIEKSPAEELVVAELVRLLRAFQKH